MPATTEADTADLQARLTKLLPVRETVLTEACRISDAVAVVKTFRNNGDAVADARRVLALANNFNTAVRKVRNEVLAKGVPADQLAVFDALLIPLSAYRGRELYGAIGRHVQAEQRTKRENRERAKRLHAHRPGEVFKLDSGGELAQFAVSPSPAIDLQARSITMTVCSPEPDCQDEVILASGIQLERFAANPICLWEHGLGDIQTPIGTWAHVDGRLSLEVNGDTMTGTCYIARGIPEADKIWSLIVQGVVRAASVHVRPIEFESRVIGDRYVKIYGASELLEISLVSVPCQAGATRKVNACGCHCHK